MATLVNKMCFSTIFKLIIPPRIPLIFDVLNKRKKYITLVFHIFGICKNKPIKISELIRGISKVSMHNFCV